VNFSLFLAGLWTVVGFGAWMWPTTAEDPALGLDPTKRLWIIGFCALLVTFNVIRWWFSTRRRGPETMDRPPERGRRLPPQEPRNPDFDFSKPEDPSKPKPG
jgi:hypothetical protein